jgi:hypothetical protein
MRRLALYFSLLLVCPAAAARGAPGVNLRCQACFGDGGVSRRAFACNANTGSHQLVAGFELGADLAAVSGNVVVIDLAADAPVLPAWWEFRSATACRIASLSFNSTISQLAVACADWGGGLSVGGIGNYIIGAPAGPNTARIVAAIAVPSGSLQNLVAGQEYFSCNLVVNNAKTAGPGACAGCAVPLCIVFSSLNLTTPDFRNDRKLTGPTNGTDSNFCTWQGGGNPQTGFGTGCPAATPVPNRTWGSVKSLYR